MSRRDTIIVAALINAGLLIILFVSALKNPSSKERVVHSSERSPAKEVEIVRHAEQKVVIGDEVDLVLSQYAKQNPLKSQEPAHAVEHVAAAQVAVVEPLQELNVAASQSFVDDLSALTKAAEQTVSAETAAVAPTQISGFDEVRVKKGDVLEKIARSHHISVQELMRINKLSSSSLRIGQVLKVPAAAIAAKVAPAKVETVASAADSTARMYTVKAGDNPWTIAVKNHMKVEDLLRLNNMDEAKARKLKPGDQIRIR